MRKIGLLYYWLYPRCSGHNSLRPTSALHAQPSHNNKYRQLCWNASSYKATTTTNTNNTGKYVRFILKSTPCCLSSNCVCCFLKPFSFKFISNRNKVMLHSTFKFNFLNFEFRKILSLTIFSFVVFKQQVWNQNPWARVQKLFFFCRLIIP